MYSLSKLLLVDACSLPVDVPSVPDNEKRTTDGPMNINKEAFRVFAIDVAVLDMEIQPEARLRRGATVIAPMMESRACRSQR